MDFFHYKNNVLHAEDVALPALAESVGAPFYCYSAATLRRHYAVFDQALNGLDRMICYAAKANSNLGVLAVLARLGAGADVVSEGEIRAALQAGFPATKIVFSGVGKTRREMLYALERDIFQFNVESLPEMEALAEVAASVGKTAAIAIRVNPDVNPQTHAKISTGQKASKFGVPMEEAYALYRRAAALPSLRAQGVSMHIGSQLTSLDPFRHAFARLRAMVERLRGEGFAIATIDLGGGLGVPYRQDEADPPLPQAYGELARAAFAGMEGTFIFEPGRLIAGNAGVLVSRVIYVKEAGGRVYVILDAAMNDLIRPSLYDAYHALVPVVRKDGAETIVADIVGPVCESGDMFALGRSLPRPSPGDLMAFRTAGAYGAVMSSTYNSRPLAPEVLVDGARHAIVRARLSYEEMLKAQSIPEWLG